MAPRGEQRNPFSFSCVCVRACVYVCVCVGFAHMVRYSIFEEFQSPNRMRLFFHTKIREHLHLPRNGRFLWFYSRDTFDVGYHLLVNNSWGFLMEWRISFFVEEFCNELWIFLFWCGLKNRQEYDWKIILRDE